MERSLDDQSRLGKGLRLPRPSLPEMSWSGYVPPRTATGTVRNDWKTGTTRHAPVWRWLRTWAGSAHGLTVCVIGVSQ